MRDVMQGASDTDEGYKSVPRFCKLFGSVFVNDVR
jgi:hypothetical protein